METHRLALKGGYQIEHFRIESILGKGGFGITYMAMDLQLGKWVAIKELLPDSIATRIDGSTVVPQSAALQENWEWARERFLDEARVLAGFSHPAIVGVHRLIEANGTVYMVMDFVDGESYEARLRRIGHEPDQASLMAVIGPILRGLEEVHNAGLIHRDIKTENILINRHGQPVLIDFGSARSAVGATMTMTSIVTHGYSPIEQYQTKGKMGPWTDIYALGAVMCRAITGEKPPVAVDRLMEDKFKWLSYRNLGGYTEPFLNAVDWAMRVRPEERPQIAGTWSLLLLEQVPVEPWQSTDVSSQPQSTSNSDCSTLFDSSEIVGIDLGTTSCFVAVIEGGYPIILENCEGARSTPSVVALGKDRRWLVGDEALRQTTLNPRNTFRSVLRYLGRKYDHLSEREKSSDPRLSSDLRGNIIISFETDLGEELIQPEELIALLLTKLKSDAENNLGVQVNMAVFAVSPRFDHLQCQALKTAALLAGIKVSRFINSTSASSIAYGYNRKGEDERILVCDLGGGTVDVSAVEIGDGVYQEISHQSESFGGDHCNNCVADWIIAEFSVETGVDFLKQHGAIQRIEEEAEKARIALSSTHAYEISLPFISADPYGPKHIRQQLTRIELETLTDALFQTTVELLRKCIEDANWSLHDVDKVVLVGGMSRMPMVQEAIQKFVGKEPFRGLNPVESIATGAAIHAGILKGVVKDTLLLEASSHTLSLETTGGIATPMIARNTASPTKKTNIFSPCASKNSLKIRVLEGEGSHFENNICLCELQMDRMSTTSLSPSLTPPNVGGSTNATGQIEVTFDIDANRKLGVNIIDQKSGDSQYFIVPELSFSDEEFTEIQYKVKRRVRQLKL